MKRLWGLFKLTLWVLAFGWLALLCWQRVWVEYQAGIYWFAIVLALISLLLTFMFIRFLKLWRSVATGDISPRLATRAIRNILADGIVFFKTGWKG